jgi:selenide,water dikinase
VNGFCDTTSLKRNNTAQEGDLLLLTKPIGTGILATAMKRDQLLPEHYQALIAQLTTLNNIGAQLGQQPGVTAMTDVTGFGLAGHLIEMAEGSNLSAELYYNHISVLEGTKTYLAQRIVPDATYRNWNGYNAKITFGSGVDVMEAFSLLPDPQTNGGLLIAVQPSALATVVELLTTHGYGAHTAPIGRMIAKAEKTLIVNS